MVGPSRLSPRDTSRRERVLDVGFAGAASLPVVGVGGKLEGAFNQIDAILR